MLKGERDQAPGHCPGWAQRRGTMAIVAFALLVTGCGREPEQVADTPPAATDTPAANDRLTVYTVNYPLAYFASRIGGDRVQVEFPAPPDGDPATWAPAGQDIAAYQKADLILLNGAGYAGWTRLVTLPEDRLVNTSASFEDQYVLAEDEETHSHGQDGEHSHEGQIAFTTWLDPQLAIAQAAAIRDALSARQPDAAGEFEVVSRRCGRTCRRWTGISRPCSASWATHRWCSRTLSTSTCSAATTSTASRCTGSRTKRRATNR